jgi:hypothetical protein
LRRVKACFWLDVVGGTLNKNAKTVLATVVFSVLVFSFASGISAVKADSAPEPEVSYSSWSGSSPLQSPSLTIVSPRNDEMFSTRNITLKLLVSSNSWVISSVYYKADWRDGLHRIFNVGTAWMWSWNKVVITANFSEIPDGRHEVTVYANIHDGSHAISTVYFTTDATPPAITILSIENKTYLSQELPLNFTADEKTSWIGYSLDGQENVTYAQNLTLNGLAYGSHTLVVYVNDTVGNMANQTITFTIANQENPVSAFIAITSGVSVAAVCLGVLFYIKKRKSHS